MTGNEGFSNYPLGIQFPMAASILKEVVVTQKTVAEMNAKIAPANIRVDHSLVGRLGSSALEVVDQLDFRVDMQTLLANVVEFQVDRALRLFCARKTFLFHVM